MCLASRPPSMPAPPPPPAAAPPLPPPPEPPLPPPTMVEGSGQRMATIQSRATARPSMKSSRGAAAFTAPTRQVQTIKGQATGLNIPQ